MARSRQSWRDLVNLGEISPITARSLQSWQDIANLDEISPISARSRQSLSVKILHGHSLGVAEIKPKTKISILISVIISSSAPLKILWQLTIVIVVFCYEHSDWDQNSWFIPLSAAVSILFFLYGSPLPLPVHSLPVLVLIKIIHYHSLFLGTRQGASCS